MIKVARQCGLTRKGVILHSQTRQHIYCRNKNKKHNVYRRDKGRIVPETISE